MKVVLDSNILVAALDSQDLFHAPCRPVFERVVKGEIEAVCPTLVLVETICVLARRTKDEPLVGQILRNLVQLPSINWLHLTLDGAERASALGLRSGLRGGDAVVLQVAEQHGVPLVTEDLEILSRAPKGIWVCRPADLPPSA